MRRELMAEAIRLSFKHMRKNLGGPFGAVVARDGKIVGRGYNAVTSTNDPTAHSEIVAIREACRTLGTYDLSGCDLYSSCEPCPMCLAAAYWAGIANIYYGNTRKDAAKIGFADEHIYEQVCLPPEKRSLPMTRVMADQAQKAFEEWEQKEDKIMY